MLLASLRDAVPAGVIVRPVQCLSVCKRPCTVALSGPDRYTYVFGDLDPARDSGALLDCVRTYGEREHGYMLWRERPEALRRGIVARIPPGGWIADDGAHPR
jgi:predicted metal-binding protein